MKWLNTWLDSVISAYSAMDMGTIEPMNFDNFHPLFAGEWVNRIRLAMKRKKQLGISYARLAKMISGPSHWRAQYSFTLADLKFARIPKKQRIEIARFFDRIANEKSKKDPYGFASSIIHTGKEINELCRKIKFNKADYGTAKFIGQLYMAGYHLCNGLYTDFYTDYGVENFGEYDMNEVFGPGHILVIKSFPDLKPMEIWSELKDSPCKTLNIYTIYKNVRFKCDSVSCHTVYEGDPVNGMVLWAVGVDGILIDSIDRLQKIKQSLEIHAQEQWKRLMGLDKESLKQKSLMMRGYIFKDMFELLGIEWRPSREMIEAVKDKPLAAPFRNFPEQAEKRKKFWKEFFDPRTEFYGN